MIAFYHSPCADGMTCAFLWNSYHPNCQLVPLDYGSIDIKQILVKCYGEEVYFLDCSVKKDVLEKILLVANKVTIIDHHKTMKEDLGIFIHDKLTVVYSVDKCGSKLILDYFADAVFNKQVSILVDYIDDRDRWQWKLHASKEISAYIATFDQDLQSWDILNHLLNHHFIESIRNGDAILKHQKKQIDGLLKLKYQKIIDGHPVYVVNSAHYQSEIGEALCSDGKFGACWFVNADQKFVWSLRSRGDFDVSAIAKQYGGGGHKNAAGFTIEYSI